MKTQTKQWFLYGTLFAALGFSISGTNKNIEGSAHLSQLAAKPSSEAEANLKAAADARKAARGNAAATTTTATPQDMVKAAEAARAAEAAKTTPPTQVEESTTADAATTDTVVAASAQISAPPVATTSTVQQRTSPRGDASATRSTPTQPNFEEYTVFVDGHNYQVSLVTTNGQTRAIYSEKPEGGNCKGECDLAARVEVFSAEESKSVSDIKTKVEKQLIPKDIYKKKKAKSTEITSDSESVDSEKETASKGLSVLKKRIHDRCRHLTKSSAETKCKVEKFVEILKADKKSAKTKRDKDGNRKPRLITDADAENYFNQELGDDLKDMLTHNFDLKDTDLYSDLRKEKSDAVTSKNNAIKLIKSLLRDIDADYSDTRAAVSTLYKTALDEQRDQVKENLQKRMDFLREKNYSGATASLANLFENMGLLRSLNNDLYPAMNDSLDFARRNGLIENDSYKDIWSSLRQSRAEILREVLDNPDFLRRTEINSLDTAISNAARGMRGTGVNSGTISSGTSSLIRVLSNGTTSSRGGGRGG